MADLLPGTSPSEETLAAAERHQAEVAPRELIPTARQLEQGATKTIYSFDEPALASKDVEKPSPRDRAREYLRGLDPRTIDGPKVPIAVFLGLGLLGGFDNHVLPLIYPEIRAEFAVTIGPLLFIAAALSYVTILIQPLYGWMADRFNRVWMVRVSAIGQNVLSIGIGTARSYMQIMGANVVGGIFTSAGHAPQTTMMADYYGPAGLARLLPLFTLAGQFAGVIGPAVAGVLISGFGWRGALFLLGGLATTVSFATFFLKEPKRGQLERLSMGATEEQSEDEQPNVKFLEAWRSLANISTIRAMWVATPFTYGGIFGVNFGLQLYWSERFGLSPGQRGSIVTAQAIVSLFVTLGIVGFLPRLMRFRPGRVMSIAGLLIGIEALIVVGLLTSNTLWLSLLLAMPLLSIFGLCLPPFGALFALLMVEVTPPRIRGVGLTSNAPFALLGLLLTTLAPMMTHSILGERTSEVTALLVGTIPMLLVGAYQLSTASSGVERDIRAARANAMAEIVAKQSRDEGRTKLLVCRDVEVSYGGTQVLFGVDLDVEAGEIVALLGTNGAGKSTLLHAIAGIRNASAGAVFLDGDDITYEPAHLNAARGVVMMPGGRAIFPSLTVKENLRAAAWMYQQDDEYVQRRTEEVLEYFPNLRPKLGQVAGTLSGGEQQMVALGQAFLMKPKLLMIDELSLGLAPAIVEQLLEILRAAHAQGTTIILVEQSLNVAVNIADRAVFMDKGKVRFSGPTEDLLARPDLVRSVFMGGGTGGASVSTRRKRPEHDEERQPFLRVEDISVSFGGVQALSGVNVDVAPGEIVGIIGPNGAGKTTLFDVISGFVTPDNGRIVLGEDDATALMPDARALLGLGRSFQNVRLFPSITVRENIAVALERRAVKNPLLAIFWTAKARREEAKLYRRVDGLIDLLGLKAFADKFVSELSTGSRRAVEVACIMASEPAMLLLDEPSSGLAQAETEELGPVLERITRETGCGLLVIEHDMTLITSISDRLIAMELGHVIAEGSPAEVQQDPRVLASYLAASNDVIQRSGTRMNAVAEAIGVGRELAVPDSPAGAPTDEGQVR